MTQGLDELIESLVAEVALCGDGCPISDLFAALRRFQKGDDGRDQVDDPEEKAAAWAALKSPLDESDMKIGRLAWKWVVETGEVSIGPVGEWNHLTFDEIMSVPEESAEKEGNVPVKDSKGKQSLAQLAVDGASKPTKLPKIRPCAYVDEEVVWRTLTGHGPDYKRVPNLEWKLLIAIGATREEGILQGDLVRATGQDKRSVPKRTDFLSLKGYIAKRTHMVRGTKTSKLWLNRFAPALPAPQNPLGGLDLSADSLTKDMEPVPWKHQWVDNRGKDGKEEIAYMALGQTIMAIIKAWGTVRIRDLKRKLGILGRKWQMKIMSRFLRRFDAQGNISYVAATFVGGNFVFKDCVRFEREPTQADWNSLLATGKKHSQYSELRDKMPTKRLPKKAVRSQKKKGKGKGRSSAINKSNLLVLNESNRAPPNTVEATWAQEKPFANTLAAFIQTGAEEGYTAPEISKATVGSAFRRQVFAHLSNLSVPDIQPSNLREYQTRSQLKVVDSSRARVFINSSAREPKLAERAQEQTTLGSSLTGNNDTAVIDDFGFGSISASVFLEDGTSDLTVLGRMKGGKSFPPRRPYVRRKPGGANAKTERLAQVVTSNQEDATLEKPPNSAPLQQAANTTTGTPSSQVHGQTELAGAKAEATPTRPTRKRKASQRVSYLDGIANLPEGQQDADTAANETPARKRRATQKTGYAELFEALEDSSNDEMDFEQDRTKPGVYLGISGSLNIDPTKKGRPRKSIVLIFRSDKLKDPDYLPGRSAYPKPDPQSAPPSHLISRPRKQPTKPLEAASDSAIPAVSHIQLEQRVQEPQLHSSEGSAPHTISSGKSSIIGGDTITQHQTPSNVSHPLKKRRALGKWICDKCGGEWKNDIGLKYHLEKAKVPCNPYYAEHPELMVKTKAVRKKRPVLASPEADTARPQTSSSNASGSSLHSTGTAQARKVSINTEKISLATNAVQSSDSAIPRPVLKQRNISKGRHGVLGIVAPRGVQVSEAAAKETAAAKLIEDSPDTTNSPGFTANVLNCESAGRSEDEDADEELPYLKQIRAEQARASRRTSSKPSITPLNDHGKSATESRKSPVESATQPADGRDTNTGLSASTHQAAMAPISYAPGILEPTASGPKAGMGPFTIGSGRALYIQYPQTAQHASPMVNGVPSFKRPQGDFIINFKDCLPSEESALRAIRITAIIEYLIDVNGGVFQTERVMHWAVLKVYTNHFPGWPMPSLAGCSRAVGELVTQGKLRKDTLAVKTTRLWRMVTIVMRPHMNITMKPVEDLRHVLRTVLPDMYIPPPFAPTESEKLLFREHERPVKPRSKGPGRRDHKLVEGIAQLTAPFYAEKGMAGIRPNYKTSRAKVWSDDEDERTAKRRKSRNANQISENGTVEFHPMKKRRLKNDFANKGRQDKYRFKIDDLVLEPHKLSIGGSHAANPGISSLPASFFLSAAGSNNDYSSPTEIQFYEPNTHLEDDYVPSPEPEECQIDPQLLAASSVNEPIQESEEPTPPTVTEESFSRVTVLNTVKGSLGTWPNVSVKWFEKNDGSVTMNGWMPTQTELLLDNLPKNMEQMAFKITSHCKTEQWADPDYGDFCTSVDGCKSYELSDQGQRNMSGSIAPHYIYINFSAKPGVSNMAPCVLQWDEKYEWTLETIPYEMLEDDDHVKRPSNRMVIPINPGDNRGRTSRPMVEDSLKPVRKYVKKADKDPNIRELKVQRELTPYPQEKHEYFRGKGEQTLGLDWKAEDTRIAAYVAVSTLMGGINKAMDWGLIMRIFPEAKLSNLRKFWTMIKKEREGFIDGLSTKFQDEFLEAYETGELEPVDFDDPAAYGEHWLELIKWTLALVVKESIELPPTREQFDNELELLPADGNEMDWRDMYHHWQRSVFNKLQDATSEPSSTRLETQEKVIDHDVIIARSWIRALCCTEPQKYTPYEIRDKFLTLVRKGGRTTTGVNELLESTILDLEHRRIAIKQKAKALSTGRPYKLNEHFSRTLDRFSNEDKFTVAAEFKLKLDTAFRKGQTVEIPWRTEDGMIIAAFNLQAHGRVRLEPIEKLDIPFGFKPGFYESRKFPKSYYRFDLKVTPTPDYLYNEDIKVLQRATATENIPSEAKDGKLPLWCDFFGQAHRHRWFKMLAGVLFVLATRGAMTDHYATQALKPCYEEFEVEAIRNWCLKEGLLQEVTSSSGAVTVTEWWWLVAGVPMLELIGENSPDIGAGAGAGEVSTVGRRSKDQYAQPLGRSRRRGKHRMIF